MLIYIVEDDTDIRELESYAMKSSGYEVQSFGESKSFFKACTAEIPQLVILDVMLPDFDGLSVLEKMRRDAVTKNVPVILVTAKGSEMDKVKGLDMGADDYITKPFSMPVLVRKIAAVLRRSNIIPNQEHQTISYDNLILDFDSYEATVDGISYELTQREFEVLRELLLNQGRVLTRHNLLAKLWKYDFYGDERVVDTHIKNLRKKLGIDFIQTIRGVGYKIDKENQK